MKENVLLITQKYRQLLFAVGLVLAGFLVLGLLNRFVFFNVIDRTNSASTTTVVFEFKFNKELDPAQSKNISQHIILSEEISRVVKVDGKKISVFLQEPASPDTNFSITLDGIRAKNGSELTKKYTYSIKYKDGSSLSAEELRATTNRSNSFETEYSLMTKLPVMGDKYEITSRFPNSNSNKMPIVIDCITTNPLPTNLQGDSILANTNDPVVIEYTNEVNQCRKLAYGELKRLEFNTDRYELVCAEPVLLSEYRCTYDEE